MQGVAFGNPSKHGACERSPERLYRCLDQNRESGARRRPGPRPGDARPPAPERRRTGRSGAAVARVAGRSRSASGCIGCGIGYSAWRRARGVIRIHAGGGRAMNDADMIHRDRWIVCLHEAGHAVACSLLLGYGASAAVWLVRGEFGRCMVMGACGTRVGDRVWNVDEAVVVACGPAAERLAWNHAPPPDPLDPDPDIPPGGLETAISESTPPPPGVNEAHGMAPDDDGLLWAWATRRTPPRRWRLARKRLTTARALARARRRP